MSTPDPRPTTPRLRPPDTRIGAAGCTARISQILPEQANSLFEQGLSYAATDHRYHQLVAETLTDRFKHLWLLLSDEVGTLRAVQPIFLVREDLLAGTPARLKGVVSGLRRLFPHAFMPNMLMVGSAAGEGFLACGDDPSSDDARWVAAHLPRLLVPIARQLRASLIVFKELPSSYRELMSTPAAAAGYARVASMPGSTIDLPYRDFDEYLAKVHSKSRREDLRKKFKRADKLAADMGGKLTMEVVSDIRPHLAEAYQLYEQVYQRARLKFEHLTPEYFSRLSTDMPDKARFFLWRLGGESNRLVAFSACLLHTAPGGAITIKDNYIGLDYSVALDMHLYFLTIRDIFNWAMANGVQTYWTAALNYDPKLNLKMRLAPLDLYVRHRSGLINKVFRHLIPLFGPTRFDKTLRQFPNFGDL